MGLGKYKGNGKGLRTQRPQGQRRLWKMHAGKVLPGPLMEGILGHKRAENGWGGWPKREWRKQEI